MELQHQAAFSNYVEANADPRLPELFSPTMAPYSPQHVLFYPPTPDAPPYGLPMQPQHAEPYFYYYPTGHASRQSPDVLASKLSPPPTGLSMQPPPPPPPPQPPFCYGPYSPPCCCCAQLHFQHLPPRCSPDHLMFPQQQQPLQLPTLAVPEFPPAAPVQTLLHVPHQPPPLVATPIRQAAAAKAAAGPPAPTRLSTRRRPSNPTELQAASGAWIRQDQQQPRRRNGYMHNILFKTELCRDMQERGACPRARGCQFAHSPAELHDPRQHPLYKTAFCYDFKNKGHCPRGERCFHVHEIRELQESAAPMPPATAQGSNGGGTYRGGGSGRGGARHRRGPGTAAEATRRSPEPPRDASEQPGTSAPTPAGSGGRRGGKAVKLATPETSYRHLMKKLSSRYSPTSTVRCRSVATDSKAVGEATELEAKARRIGL